jgi:hypothetical protein
LVPVGTGYVTEAEKKAILAEKNAKKEENIAE